jgi:hypothetical protein
MTPAGNRRSPLGGLVQDWFDVEYRSVVKRLQLADLDPEPLGGDDLDAVQADGVGAAGGTGAEDPVGGRAGSSQGRVTSTSRAARVYSQMPQAAQIGLLTRLIRPSPAARPRTLARQARSSTAWLPLR